MAIWQGKRSLEVLTLTLQGEVSDGSTSRGWIRAHLISKDSQRAPLGIYLTHGVTGLLIEMLNRGVAVGQGLALVDPVATLRIDGPFHVNQPNRAVIVETPGVYSAP